eukprot:895745-Pleurochrysis_carterae.AAC.1
MHVLGGVRRRHGVYVRRCASGVNGQGPGRRRDDVRGVLRNDVRTQLVESPVAVQCERRLVAGGIRGRERTARRAAGSDAMRQRCPQQEGGGLRLRCTAQPLSTTRASRPPLPCPRLRRLCRPASRALAGDAGGEQTAGGRRRRARRRERVWGCAKKRRVTLRVLPAVRRMAATAPCATCETCRVQQAQMRRTRSARYAGARSAERRKARAPAVGNDRALRGLRHRVDEVACARKRKQRRGAPSAGTET